MDDDDLETMDELIAAKDKLAAVAADIERKILRRARIDELVREIPKLEDQHRLESSRLSEKQSLSAEVTRKIEAAHDVKTNEIAAAKDQVSTANKTIESLEVKLQKAHNALNTVEAHLTSLEKDATTYRLESRRALQQLQEDVDSSKIALASVSTELHQKKQELRELDPKHAADTIEKEAPGTCRSTGAESKHPGDPIEEETADEHDTATEGETPFGCTTAVSKNQIVAPGVASGHFAKTNDVGRTVQTHNSAPPVENASTSEQSAFALSSQAVGVPPATEATEHEENSMSCPAGEPVRPRSRRLRPTVANMTDRQKALHQELANFYAATEEPDRDKPAPQPQASRKMPVPSRAAAARPATDDGEQTSADTDKLDDTAYGHSTHECSLSRIYPTVVYVKESDAVQGKWCELKCPICYTNTSVEQLDFFSNITALVQHISHNHGSKIYHRKGIARKCVVREFSPQDVEHLRRGKNPINGAPIVTTWGDLSKRSWKSSDDEISGHPGSDGRRDSDTSAPLKDVQDTVHGTAKGNMNDLQNSQPPIRNSHIVERNGPEHDLASIAAVKGPGGIGTASNQFRPTLATATAQMQSAEQSSWTEEQSRPSMPGLAIKGAAALAGTRPSTNKMLQDREGTGISTATPSRRETPPSSKSHAIGRSEGKKRTYSEVTPPKASRFKDVLHPDLLTTALIDEEWRIISCRDCSANADRSPDSSSLTLFYGLSGLAKHFGQCHPERQFRFHEPRTFAHSERLPEDFLIAQPNTSSFRIVPHAGDKASNISKPGATPVVSTETLSTDLCTTVKIDNAWFWISCKYCSANAHSKGMPFRGVRSLAHHVRKVHCEETDFDDLESWCTLTGPIDRASADIAKRLGGNHGLSVTISTGHTASAGNESRDPRLQGRIGQPRLSNFPTRTPAQRPAPLEKSSVLPQMIDAVAKALPFVADRVTILRAIEAANGNIDLAVKNLRDARENGPRPSTPQASLPQSSLRRAKSSQTLQRDSRDDRTLAQPTLSPNDLFFGSRRHMPNSPSRAQNMPPPQRRSSASPPLQKKNKTGKDEKRN